MTSGGTGTGLTRAEWSELESGLGDSPTMADRLEFGRLCSESGHSLSQLADHLRGAMGREAIRYHIEVWRMSSELPLGLPPY